MAIRTCRECGNQVSDKARTCPHCGAPGPVAPKPGFEWKSRTRIFGIPLVHVAFGRDRKRRLRVAKGFIAIGQFAIGAITIAQFGVGIIFGLGQFMFGLTAVGQIALAVIFGAGQVATGLVAIGQIVVAVYGLAQFGWAVYLWSPQRVDMEAVALFHTLLLRIRQFLGM